MTIRSDQIIELEKVQERLVDLVLKETDPAEWVRDTPDNRKERLEQKRSAASTLTIITKISSILGFLRGGKPLEDPPEGTVAAIVKPENTVAEITAAAKEAKELLGKYGRT